MQKSLSSKLVLFDLDGTVIDTAPDFVLSLNNILKRGVVFFVAHGEKKIKKCWECWFSCQNEYLVSSLKF